MEIGEAERVLSPLMVSSPCKGTFQHSECYCVFSICSVKTSPPPPSTEYNRGGHNASQTSCM